MMGAPGFDDSPFEDVKLGSPKEITLVYPYYENPKFLAKQLQNWSKYNESVRQFIRVIVVDDGSPRDPAEHVLRGARVPFPIRLFRIDVDVRWNWLAARNIGMKHAGTEWRLMTDMDHVVEPTVAVNLTAGQHDPCTIYRFSRREHSGAAIHPHPNSMLLTGAMFWKIGGYDENLSGHYGTDGDWRRRCAEGARIRILKDELVRHEYIDDSSTTHYKRKQPEDAGKKAIIARRGRGWKPKTLSFPYHEVDLCSM